MTVQVEAPMEATQAVKEALGMRLEGIGMARVTDIQDDGYGKQESFINGMTAAEHELYSRLRRRNGT